MGLFKKNSWHSNDAPRTVVTTNLCPMCEAQPDIRDFKVLRMEQKDPYILVEVKYGNTTNYEGRKVMILRMSPVELVNANSLDPHFHEHGPVVARFEPTEQGWAFAEAVLQKLLPVKRR